MNKKARFLTVFLFILLLLQTGSLSASYQHPYVINYSRSDYNAASKNWCVTQDDKGIVYFGNNVGLLESDGLEWHTYDIPGVPLVRSVVAVNHDLIYSGGNSDFGVWKRDEFGELHYTSLSSMLSKPFPSSESIWRIQIMDDLVYFQSFSNIFIYDGKSIETLTMDGGFLFLEKVHGNLYVQNIKGAMYQLEGKEFRKIKGSDIFVDEIVRVIAPYGGEDILVGTSSGKLFIFDGQRFTVWNTRLSETLKTLELNCAIYSTKRDTFFLGTILDGIYEVDTSGNLIYHYCTSNFLQNNTALSLFEDNDKNIWVALDKGLSYFKIYDSLSFYSFDRKNSKSVYDVVFWNGNFYLGTNQGLFYMPESDLFSRNYDSTLFRLIPGTQGQVWSLHVINGTLYCCHNDGLILVDRVHNARKSPLVEDGLYGLIYADEQKETMIGVGYKGVWLFDYALQSSRMISSRPYSIYKSVLDVFGNVWLETYNKGVFRCRLSEGKDSFQVAEYFGKDNFDDLPEKLQVFRWGKRTVFLGDDTFYSYDEVSHRLKGITALNDRLGCVEHIRNIKSISGDDAWIITDHSVLRCSYDGNTVNIKESYNLELDNNLALVTFYENIAVINDSVSVICNDDGFIVYNNQEGGQDCSNFRKPLVESIRIYDFKSAETERIPSGMAHERISIPFRSNNLALVVKIPNAFASNLKMEYYLEGINTCWSQATKKNEILYERLPIGKYKLHIRSTDQMGHFSDTETLDFEILPPWYQTTAWYAFCVIFVIFVVCAILIVYRRRLKQKHALVVKELEEELLHKEFEQLQSDLEQHKAEMLTQASMIIAKNELVANIKSIIDETCKETSNRALQNMQGRIHCILNKEVDEDKDWKIFLMNFEEKHPYFFRKLKGMTPDLTDNDLKLCACLKLNMNSKDIASLMSVTVRSVENNRYRLRKKFNLDPSQNLNEFFITID